MVLIVDVVRVWRLLLREEVVFGEGEEDKGDLVVLIVDVVRVWRLLLREEVVFGEEEEDKGDSVEVVRVWSLSVDGGEIIVVFVDRVALQSHLGASCWCI